MGNIQNRLGTAADKFLQPFQGFDIQVVGGFVQKVAVRAAQSEKGHTQLYLFPAGECAHGPVRVEKLLGKPQRRRRVRQFPGGTIQKRGLFTAEFIGCFPFVLCRKLLGKIAQYKTVFSDCSAPLHVPLHHVLVIDQLQQGGFSVALLADHRRLIPGV